jgi:uncharacterized protein YjiS (DUF1127 family)
MFILIARPPPLAASNNLVGAAYRSGQRLRSIVGRLRQTIGRWVARSRQRRALREIAESDDRHLLRDIGVSREEAFHEADKWFWHR